MGEKFQSMLKALTGLWMHPAQTWGNAGKPDLRWYKTPAEIAQLPKLQDCPCCAEVTAPGGELCYSTCTINPAENEDLVAAFVATHPNFELKPFERRLPEKLRRLSAKRGMLQLLPSEDGLDGFFFALLERIS